MSLKKKDKLEIINYLNSQRLMTLATHDKAPWVCSVYYVVDEELNLYFVSSPDTKHCRDIEKNNNVACAITDSHIKNSEKKTGMQIQGTALQVKGWEKTRKLLSLWHKINPGSEKINIKNMQTGVVSSRVYKIKPTLIKYMNKGLYGDDTYGLFKLNS